jgi:hypothetical protein
MRQADPALKRCTDAVDGTSKQLELPGSNNVIMQNKCR